MFSLRNIFGAKALKEEEKHRTVYLVTDKKLRESLVNYVEQELERAVSFEKMVSRYLEGSSTAEDFIAQTKISLEQRDELHKLIQWTPDPSTKSKCGSGWSIPFGPGVVLHKGGVYLSVPNPLHSSDQDDPADVKRYADELAGWEKTMPGLQKVTSSPFGYETFGIGSINLSGSEKNVKHVKKSISAARFNPGY